MRDLEINGDTAHFCTDNQCVSLHPPELSPTSVASAAPRMPRLVQIALVCMTGIVISCLIALFVVALQPQSPERKKDPLSQERQVMSLEDNNIGQFSMERPKDHHSIDGVAGVEAAILTFKDHMENSSSWHTEIQMLKCRVDNVSAQVQVLEGHLGNASADIQMAKGALKDASVWSFQTQVLRSSLEVTDGEIQRLKGDLEKANSITSQMQSFLKNSSESTSTELHMLSRDLKSAYAEIQTLKAQLEVTNGQAQWANSSLENANAEIHALKGHLGSINELKTQDQVLRSSLEEAQAAIQRLKGNLQKANALNNQTQTLVKVRLDNTRAETQELKSHLEKAGPEINLLKTELASVTAQMQIVNSRLEKADAQVQGIKAKLEDTSTLNSQIQLLNSKLRNASKEIQTIQTRMKDVSALNSQAQMLESNLQNTNAEMQRLKEDLKNTTALISKIQEEQSHLGNLHVTDVLQEQLRSQSQLLQLALEGWKAHKGSLYYFSQEKKSWQEAEKFCVSQGAHLASVTSQEEQAFVVRFTSPAHHWIGLTDKGSEGSWYWVDGTPFNSAGSKGFWDRNQPDNWLHANGEREDCVQVQKKWNDISCSASFPWVCKKSMGLAGAKAAQS